MTGLTQALAAFVAKPTFGNNEQGALAVAKTGFMDTIATMMAGHNEPVVNIVRQFFANTTTPAEAPVPVLPTKHCFRCLRISARKLHARKACLHL